MLKLLVKPAYTPTMLMRPACAAVGLHTTSVNMDQKYLM